MRNLVLVLICALALPAMAQPSNLRLPDEAAGKTGLSTPSFPRSIKSTLWRWVSGTVGLHWIPIFGLPWFVIPILRRECGL